MLKAEDWTGIDLKFRLAEAVLRDDIKTVKGVMSEIGANGSIDKFMYRDWPLFRSIKQNEAFKSHFKKIFGESFDLDEVVEPKAAIAQIDKTEPHIEPNRGKGSSRPRKAKTNSIPQIQ